MMRRQIWLVGLACAAVIAIGGVTMRPFQGMAQQNATPTSAMTEGEDSASDATPVVGSPMLQPTIDLIAAQQAALKDQAGASVVAVDLNGEDGVLVFDIELDNGYDIQVDATSGVVLKSEPESNDDNGNADDNGDDHGEHENAGHDDQNEPNDQTDAGEGEDGD